MIAKFRLKKLRDGNWTVETKGPFWFSWWKSVRHFGDKNYPIIMFKTYEGAKEHIDHQLTKLARDQKEKRTPVFYVYYPFPDKDPTK